VVLCLEPFCIHSAFSFQFRISVPNSKTHTPFARATGGGTIFGGRPAGGERFFAFLNSGLGGDAAGTGRGFPQSICPGLIDGGGQKMGRNLGPNRASSKGKKGHWWGKNRGTPSRAWVFLSYNVPFGGDRGGRIAPREKQKKKKRWPNKKTMYSPRIFPGRGVPDFLFYRAGGASVFPGF